MAGTEIPLGGGNIPEVYLRCTRSPPEGFCSKTGSDESHFTVSLTVKGGVTRVTRAESQDDVHKPQLLKTKESQ